LMSGRKWEKEPGRSFKNRRKKWGGTIAKENWVQQKQTATQLEHKRNQTGGVG